MSSLELRDNFFITSFRMLNTRTPYNFVLLNGKYLSYIPELDHGVYQSISLEAVTCDYKHSDQIKKIFRTPNSSAYSILQISSKDFALKIQVVETLKKRERLVLEC